MSEEVVISTKAIATIEPDDRGTLVVAGDWGSSVMRLHLCRRDAATLTPLATIHGPGIKDVFDAEAAYRRAAEPWLATYGPLPLILSGMVGSTLGWRETAYVACPATVNALAHAALKFTVGDLAVVIAPGLSCINIVGQPDMMRGEEVQLYGWLDGLADDDSAERLICLPGTHAKWVRTRGARVLDFLTSMQGETYDLLLRHGLLGRSLDEPWDSAAPVDVAEFDRGVALIAAQPQLAVLQAIFALRSRRLAGDLCSVAAPSFLSGLMIGADLRDGLRLHAACGYVLGPVVLIGSTTLVKLYARAAAMLGIAIIPAVDDGLALAGLGTILNQCTA